VIRRVFTSPACGGGDSNEDDDDVDAGDEDDSEGDHDNEDEDDDEDDGISSAEMDEVEPNGDAIFEIESDSRNEDVRCVVLLMTFMSAATENESTSCSRK